MPFHPVYGNVQKTGKNNGLFTEVIVNSGRVPEGKTKIYVGSRVLSSVPYTGKPILVIDKEGKKTKET